MRRCNWCNKDSMGLSYCSQFCENEFNNAMGDIMNEENNKKAVHPLNQILEGLVGEATKQFLTSFHKLHDLVDAEPNEFISGAVMLNKTTGQKTLYTLTLVAEPNATEERINQYTEEMIAKKASSVE